MAGITAGEVWTDTTDTMATPTASPAPAPAPAPPPQRVDALRVQAKVLPGKRIELTAPELLEGATVEVIVVLPSPVPPVAREHVIDIVASLPPGPRSAPTWEEVERQFREERDAWDKDR